MSIVSSLSNPSESMRKKLEPLAAALSRYTELNMRLRNSTMAPESLAFRELAKAGIEAKREAQRLEAEAYLSSETQMPPIMVQQRRA